LLDTTIVPQQTEITQFIFGQPLRDPPSDGLKRHDLLGILMIVLSGGRPPSTGPSLPRQSIIPQQLSPIEERRSQPRYFSRVFRQLDPDQFRIRFQKFVARFGEPTRE
jgi:hypothetical protein